MYQSTNVNDIKLILKPNRIVIILGCPRFDPLLPADHPTLTRRRGRSLGSIAARSDGEPVSVILLRFLVSLTTKDNRSVEDPYYRRRLPFKRYT